MIPKVRTMAAEGWVDAAGQHREQNTEEKLGAEDINLRAIAALQRKMLSCGLLFVCSLLLPSPCLVPLANLVYILCLLLIASQRRVPLVLAPYRLPTSWTPCVCSLSLADLVYILCLRPNACNLVFPLCLLLIGVPIVCCVC